jgi:phospholipid transport system substrate-binding protein
MFSFIARFNLFLLISIGLISGVQAQQKPDPMAAPNEFVQQIADQVLNALKADSAVRAGDIKRDGKL